MQPAARFNFISVFAGGGGLHRGLESAGLQPLLATDLEASSEQTFKLNYPQLPFIRADIRHLTKEQVSEACGDRTIHVIAGGPPCQGFSTLGDQLLGDSRNQLFWHFLRLVRWLSPQCFLMENVNYLRSQYGGKFEREIQSACADLGYRVLIQTLNAADFGVPQIRKRVFFLATRLDSPFHWPSHTHSDNGLSGTSPYKTVWEAIGDLPAPEDEAVSNHQALRHSEKVVQRYILIPEGGRMPPPQQLPPEIRRRNFGNTYKRLHRDRPSLTLVPGNNAFPIHPTAHRSLTPREGARLQTFPDDHAFAGNRSEQCRLVGNAVPVLLAHSLGHSIGEHLASATMANGGPTNATLGTKVLKLPRQATAGRERPTAVSFFSGAGGLMLGFINAGCHVLSSYDRKNIVSQNMALNFPDIPHHKAEVEKLTASRILKDLNGQSVDIVFGGPPCQGFSIFGRRRFVNTKGHRPETDERNDLTLRYIALAVKLSPKVIFMENVKGFVSTPRGQTSYLDSVSRKLKRAGYNVHYQIINCADYGVPQTRERFILVAVKSGLTMKWPERKHHASPKPWQRAYATVADVITDLMDTATQSEEFSHVPMNHKALVVQRLKLIPEGGRLPEDKLPARLRKGYRTDRVKNYSHVFKRLSMNAPATTLVPGHNAFPVHPKLHRTLTVREAARIQTFPDWMRFQGTRQQQCMLVGNAVPPLLAEIFAQHIIKAIKGNFADPGSKSDIYELRMLA